MAADELSNGAKTPGGQVVKLHKYAAKTDEARRRQLSNLEAGAAVKAGIHSEAKLRPVREAHLDELLAEFGATVRRDWLELAAAVRARVSLGHAYIDRVGIVKHARHGSTYPVVERVARDEARYCALLERIEAMHREADASRGATLADIAAEYAAAGESTEDGERT